jgi:hypothetical protein
VKSTEDRARFVNSGTTPPCGYVYETELAGVKFRFQAPMRVGMMKQLRDWHRDKGLEWPGDAEMSARLEEYICGLVPDGFCTGGPDHRPSVKFLSAGSIRAATRLIADRLFKGKSRLVAPEEAERRAKICANCPSNLHGICTSCAGNEFQDLFVWFLRQGRKTTYDSVLDTCATCGCLLRAKVHIGIEDMARLEKREYPENCWAHNTLADKNWRPE